MYKEVILCRINIVCFCEDVAYTRACCFTWKIVIARLIKPTEFWDVCIVRLCCERIFIFRIMVTSSHVNEARNGMGGRFDNVVAVLHSILVIRWMTNRCEEVNGDWWGGCGVAMFTAYRVGLQQKTEVSVIFAPMRERSSI